VRVARREEAMNLSRLLAAAFVMLALVGCAQMTPGQRQTPYAPYLLDESGNTNDRGPDM
jgi:hypothetical protein